MNHRVKLIWNAVDAYVNANYETLSKDKDKAWLIEWRDMNCPHSRVQDLLAKRIEQVNQAIGDPKNPVDIQAKAILGEVEKQMKAGVSGKRLLLEVVSRVDALRINPENAKKQAFDALANDLTIKYPKLRVLGGLMKAFLGVLLYVPSFGKTKDLISKGVVTMKSGLKEAVETRNSMVQALKEIRGEGGV